MGQIEHLGRLQEWRSPVLDALMRVLELPGDEKTYLILIPLILWWFNRRMGMRLLGLALTGSLAVKILKEIFDAGRPFVFYPHLFPFFQEAGAADPAFPSGHAFTAAMFWLAAAMEFKSQKLFFWGLPIVLLSAWTRLYFGMHWMEDVIFGLAWGALGSVLFYWALSQGMVKNFLSRRPLIAGAAGALSGFGAAFLLCPDPFNALGLDMGELGIGILAFSWAASRPVLDPEEPAPLSLPAKGVLSGLGLGVLVLLYLFIRPLYPPWGRYLAMPAALIWVVFFNPARRFVPRLLKGGIG